MFGRLGFFILGATVGPLLHSALRVAAREVVRTGYIATRELERMYAEVREDFDDVRAEARASADHRTKPKAHSPKE